MLPESPVPETGQPDGSSQIGLVPGKNQPSGCGVGGCDRGLEFHPDDHMLHFNAAKLERRGGLIPEAIKRLSRFICLDLENRVLRRFHFELGRLHELQEDSENAFIHFQEGNRLASEAAKAGNITREPALAEIKRLSAMLDQPGIAAAFAGNETGPGEQPVFLIGFPKSGTTLLDQILDSHGQLQVLEEKPALQEVKKYAAQMEGGFPGALPGLGREEIRVLRQIYFDSVNDSLPQSPESRLIDKMPLNIINVPLILKLFPQAKFILAVRHPHDVCLSCFMQNFRLNSHMVNFLSLKE